MVTKETQLSGTAGSAKQEATARGRDLVEETRNFAGQTAQHGCEVTGVCSRNRVGQWQVAAIEFRVVRDDMTLARGTGLPKSPDHVRRR